MSKIKIFLILTIILFSSFIFINNSKAATISASSCSQADVQFAIDLAQNGDIVTVPIGTCVWGNQINIATPITLQGAGIDKTNIDCTALVGSQCIKVTVAGSGNPIWRVTEFTFISGGGVWNEGVIAAPVPSTGRNWRIDHNKFVNWQTNGIWISSSYGVIDHNIFEKNVVGGGSAEAIHVHNNLTGVDDKGYAAWDIPYVWGTPDAIFVEDNTFNFFPNGDGSGAVVDGEKGARYVIRHNTIVNGVITVHGLDTGRARGGIMGEIYNNVMTRTGTNNALGRAIHLRSGIAVMHDNIVSGYPKFSSNYPYRASPSENREFWAEANGTQWSVCSLLNNYVCNPSVPNYPDFTSYGDAYCDANDSSKAVSTCSRKFCSLDRDYLCDPSSDPCPALGKGTCSSYLDGSTDPVPYPLRDQPGIGPGGQVSQPIMSWGNSFCSQIGCIPSLSVNVVIGEVNPAMQENRDYFNCASQADCQTRVNAYQDSIGAAHTGTYHQYPYPHPLTLTGSTPPSTDTTPPAAPTGLSVN